MTSPLLTALRDTRERIASTNPADTSEVAVARRLTRDLEETIARLEGNDTDRDIVSIMCHDLKDPLASIVMGAGFLRKTIAGEDAAASRVVDAIARSAERMSQVISDFHDLAKLEAGRLPVELRSWDVVAVLRTALGPFETQAAERGVGFEIQAPRAPLLALCDRGRLVQIAGKLVTNALKFTAAEGRVVVGMSQSDAGVCVRVSDTGRGISADRLPTIFDRAANARRSPRDGPGMGLAIVRGLVELQNGSVAVESRVDHGSTFTFVLPGG